MEKSWRYFYEKKLTKQKFQEILRRHQEAFDEMDSEERKRHHEYLRAKKENDEALGKVYRKYYKGKMNAGQLRQLAGRQGREIKKGRRCKFRDLVHVLRLRQYMY